MIMQDSIKPPIRGIIASFRRSRHRVYHNQIIVLLDNIDNRTKAAKLRNKKLVINIKNRKLEGVVAGPHGNKGAIRAVFRHGLSPHCLGCRVEVKED